jgi:hypothetical protein
MIGYPTLSDIEIKWRASGSGVCVIVEGETEQEDPWFYNKWFGDRAREITFFPQDGWEKVVVAVTNLRAGLGPKCVYGILDRDFENLPSYPATPADGILRTQKYTLENYLLDPRCWYKYVRPHTLRSSKPGWNSLEEARATIEELYRECLPLSAFNWTLRHARDSDYAAFRALPDASKVYKEHPKAIENLGDAVAYLQSVQTQMGLPHDLGQMYLDRLAELQAMPPAAWEEVVSGKYVLNLLRERFPLRLSGKETWDDVLGAYVHGCPEPHPDLMDLVELILQDAHS